MDSMKKKELKNNYIERETIGGVYCIECSGNNHSWLKSANNLEGQKNRFDFAIKTNSCPEPAMRAKWSEYGAKSFSFKVLEELKKKKTQTDKEFSDDISVLFEMWNEKLNS